MRWLTPNSVLFILGLTDIGHIRKDGKMAKKNTTYTEVKEKAVCCGKIYISTDKPIKNYKCKNCGRQLVAVKLPYVYKVEEQ